MVASAEKIHDAMLLAAFLFAASLRTTCRLAATVAVTGIASWFAATLAVASITSWFAATVTGIASWLAAALFAVLALAMSKQALQPAEQIMLLAMLLATSFGTAGRLAAAVTGVASWFAATVAVAGTASWFTGVRAATISGTAIGLTTRGRALVSEHPIEDLKTEGLTTNGHANNQRAEEQHTLHRATSPLLVDHARAFVAIATFDTPRL